MEPYVVFMFIGRKCLFYVRISTEGGARRPSVVRSSSTCICFETCDGAQMGTSWPNRRELLKCIIVLDARKSWRLVFARSQIRFDYSAWSRGLRCTDMQVGSANGSVSPSSSSSSAERFLMQGVESSRCRQWRSTSLGFVLILISCSSLLVATSYHYAYGSEVVVASSLVESFLSFSFLPSFTSIVLWHNDALERGVERRQLIELDEGKDGASTETKASMRDESRE
ncbi:hypothetical protein R1sor_016541 [Riccia sorocarpa]|uniref:Transmembrane protein n=1 Tax=Riccia sorocarpa TaxID=122646 RepID=A0ABD3HI32_9MARC